jgi:hypothetical protein
VGFALEEAAGMATTGATAVATEADGTATAEPVGTAVDIEEAAEAGAVAAAAS